MGTRSAIFVELTKEDKEKLNIFNTELDFLMLTCSYDGYPSYMGKVLLKYYNTQKKAFRLVNKAKHVSAVEPTIKETKKNIVFKGISPIPKEDVYAHWRGSMMNYIYVYSLNEGWRVHQINYRTDKLTEGRLLQGWLNVNDL